MTTISVGERILLAAGLALVLGAGGAGAADPCLGDAKHQKRECKTDCKDDFRFGIPLWFYLPL